MKKPRIFTPGPTPLPDRVAFAAGHQAFTHRSSDFKNLYTDLQSRLQTIYQTKNPVVVLTASGTGGMESALGSALLPGSSVLIVQAGKFGKRWTSLARHYGLTVKEWAVEPGARFPQEAYLDLLKSSGSFQALLFQASETSTGYAFDVEFLANNFRKYNEDGLVFVDAITALGVVPVLTDAWDLDFVISGSQKALMCPPGLATISVSPRGQEALRQVSTEKASRRPYYLNLLKELESGSKGLSSWTPAFTLFQSLHEASGMILEEGLESVWKRHQTLATLARSAVEALGLKLLSPYHPASSVTAFYAPSDSKVLTKYLQTELGLYLAGGQDEYEGKILRISHMGYFDYLDLVQVVASLELVLYRHHYRDFQWGDGLKTLQKLFDASMTSQGASL